MSRKIYCNNPNCKHHCEDDKCDTTVKLDYSGKCLSFEKRFSYYFRLVWNALKDKKLIDEIEILKNPDLRIGMYYVMECYDLGFSEIEWGTCRMFALKDGEDGEPLNYEQITARELNMEKFEKHFNDFQNGIMPTQMQNEKEQSSIEPKEFGWLSPMGVFTKSPFGTHEESAERICEEKGFIDEYWEWVKENRGNEIGHLMRDFLSQVKGYCLIHNPSGYVGYIVTNMKPLTKHQKEFLYNYFMDMGDNFKAEQYLD